MRRVRSKASRALASGLGARVSDCEGAVVAAAGRSAPAREASKRDARFSWLRPKKSPAAPTQLTVLT